MTEPKKTTLYDIGEEMERLFQMLLVDQADHEEFKKKFAEVETQLSTKMLACRHVVRMWEGQAKALREEEKRLADRRRSLESARVSVLGRVRGVMEKGEMKEFLDKGTSLGFRLQKNPPSCDVTDIDALSAEHPEFVHVDVTEVVDKKAILAHHKETGEIPYGVTIEQKKRVVVL